VKNEWNTSMSEKAKVHHTDEAIAIIWGGPNIWGKRYRWIVGLIETHWQKYCPCTVAPPRIPFFVFPILPEWPASRKTELQKNYLSAFRALSALQNTRVFWRFAHKFHQEVNGSKLSLHWLAQLSENPVKGACGQSLFVKKIFHSAVFSNKFFCLKQTL